MLGKWKRVDWPGSGQLCYESESATVVGRKPGEIVAVKSMMNRLRCVVLVAGLLLLGSAAVAADMAPATTAARKVRLFILSGQSNMVGLNPEESFTPALRKAFPDDELIVVKHASSGQLMKHWYKDWKLAPGDVTKGNGKIYDLLMSKVKEAMAGKVAPASVSFVWMQGEADTNHKGYGDVYAAALQGLLEQLQADLGRKDIDFVLGRISDFGNELPERPDWNLIRKVQVQFAEGYARGAWVDTDDLNGKANGLHYPPDGYRKMGERFAQRAVELVEKGRAGTK